MTRVIMPETLESLWDAMTAAPEARLFCGGTDLLVRHRREGGGSLIGIDRIAALRGIRYQDGDVVIGAATRFSDILEDPLIRAHLPVLARGVAALASPTIRAMASIGGNIVTASPAADSLPALTVLSARLDLASPNAHRTVALREFITGSHATGLRPGEIVTAVRIALAPRPALHHAEKVGQRRMLSGTLVSLAAVIAMDDDGRIEQASLAFGNLGPTVLVSVEAEAELIGRRLDRDALAAAGVAVRRAARPQDDVRASAAYRLRLAGNLLFRLLDPKIPIVAEKYKGRETAE
ncbi:MAG TPA: FAD binding domain-containing protein [Telmatospirillum sp.]|nr:FAD binding domain-containing protein [Telmatospirillum sp.]